MRSINKETSKRVWLFALLLFVCVAATAAAVISILSSFQMDASGAIELAGEASSVSREDIVQTAAPDAPTVTVPEREDGTDSGDAPIGGDSGAAAQTAPAPQRDTPLRYTSRGPKLESRDEELVWSTETQVELFRAEYANEEGVITVQSANGEKVIAPGTENSYTFKLKNTGSAPLEYTVDVSAFFTAANEAIPMTARLSRYDGKWIVGDGDSFIPVAQLGQIEDSATLGAGKFTYYTLDWCWPFESGDDARDTALGAVTATQDLSFTLVIETTATTVVDPSPSYPGGDGLDVPKTGDDFSAMLWTALAVGAGMLFVILLVAWRRDEETEEASEA